MNNSNYFIHELAICESTNIGNKTNIWAFAHVLPGANVGSNCNICDHVFIENEVTIGNRVTIKSGVQLWDGIHVEDDVFIGPNTTFTNDPYPRSKKYLAEYPQTTIKQGASIGANSTILPGLTIGQNAMVGAGSVVTKNVPPHAIVVGNPAKIINYETNENQASTIEPENIETLIPANNSKKHSPLNIGECSIHLLPSFNDMRGDLMAMEFSENLPFKPKRCFFVHNVPSNKVRGEHAHKLCHQFLIPLNGNVSVVIDDGVKRKEILLNSSSIGLYIPPRIWGVQYKFTSDAVLAVFASHHYDPDDYIRDYNDFLKSINIQL